MKGKLVASIEEVIRLCGLKDGMTVSFHHHLRDGDQVLPMVMAKIQEMGFHDITVSASSIHGSHGCLADMIREKVVTGIDTNFIHKCVGQTISDGYLEKPAIFRTPGHRPPALAPGAAHSGLAGGAASAGAGAAHIDIAFIAASAADCQGNMNGVDGPSAFGPMGYAFADAQYADKVVVITDYLTDYPLTPISIDERYVDYVVKVDSIGDTSGITTISKDPLGLKIAMTAVGVLQDSDSFEDGFIFQTGGGRTSLATTKFLKEAMDRQHVHGACILGGINGLFVDLLEGGYFDKIVDTQCFDLRAVESLKKDVRHQEISCGHYADMCAKSCVAAHLTTVMLGATEIDTDFNVNIHTDSNGIIMGGSGGHTDLAHGAKLTVIVTPLLRQRRAAVLDKVGTKSTLGDSVDVLVTQRGIAVNPRHEGLRERLEAAGRPVKDIHELRAMARELTGEPKPVEFTDRVVAEVHGYDGKINDYIYQLKR